MTNESTVVTPDARHRRGFTHATADSLERSLRSALDTMATTLYGQAGNELSATEMEVLRRGGVDVDRPVTRDPFEEPVALFAALIESSLGSPEVAERLGIASGQVRQMIARRTLYSVKLDGRRYAPLFQFRQDGPLSPDISLVNAALPADMHPVEVHDWYTSPDADLTPGGGKARTASPLQWLDSGGDPDRLVRFVKRL